MAISRHFVDELIAHVDIVETIDSYLPLKKEGANFVACCPFHNEKTPSFKVSSTKQIYHCFGCGVGGNVISFVMEYERVDFIEAIEQLASRAGLTIPRNTKQQHAPVEQDYYQLLEQVAQYFQQQLRQHPAAKQAIHYLKQRGLSGEIAKKFGLGYAPSGWNNVLTHFNRLPNAEKALLATGMLTTKTEGRTYDRFRHRIMFPIRDKRGRVIGFGGRVLDDDTPKYLNSPETPIFHKGRELYGLYEVLQSQRQVESIIIVEGYMDVLALAQYGVDYAVATLGTATSQTHLQQLLRYTKVLTFCFDGDEAGKTAAWRALKASLSILRDGIQIRFMWLSAHHDPDSFIREVGLEAFTQHIRQADNVANVFFNYLQTNIDLQTMEGKSQLIHEAIPLLRQIPGEAFLHMMLEQLSRKVHISIDQLKVMLHSDPQKSSDRQQHRPPLHQQLPSNMRLAITLLLQNPQLNQTSHNIHVIDELTGAASDFLRELYCILKEHPHYTTGNLLEYFRNKATADTFSQLATWEHSVPSAGIQAEFSDALSRLQQQSKAKLVEELLHKASTSGLSNEEKIQLNQLIRMLKEIT